MERCELCNKPLSDADASRHRTGDGSLLDAATHVYCGECTDPIGSLFEVLNYFRLPVLTLVKGWDGIPFVGPDGRLSLAAWPGRKDVLLHHARASEMFPLWDEIVSAFKQLKGIRHFDNEALIELIKYLTSKYDSPTPYEILCIARRSEILETIRHDIEAAAARVEIPREVTIPIIIPERVHETA